MSLYDTYEDHKEFQNYSNMGIQLTALIPVLQEKKDFQFSKTLVIHFQNFPLCISLNKMGIFCGTPKSYRI